ncbi:MAG: 3-deoxy-manno-octulosonate cytidylyltransferase [Phycisphaera sp.]|nr:MAG: 3-deoxy-manno-octulosonate cytidylyltransferase [Phycisphaera sp.]
MARGKAIAIIPARMESTRFPGKPLASETGKPMVVHVCEQAAKAQAVSRVVVATDSQEIAEAVVAHGFEAVMTSEDHPNGTSRLAEAAETLKLRKSQDIVNVQGDEPEIEPETIDGALRALEAQLNASWEVGTAPHLGRETYAAVGTVASPLARGDDPSNPNIVKVVIGTIEPQHAVAPALYFTRADVPHFRDHSVAVPRLKHVGIYAYLYHDLRGYVGLPPTPLEQCEQLEQLRWLEHGLPIAVAVRQAWHQGIDTPEQYAAFVERYRTRGEKT